MYSYSYPERYPAERAGGQGCLMLARMYERANFYSGGERCQRLEEHEQFTKIASPPRRWGSVFCALLMVSIFLSNELAHTRLNMLTHEDRQRPTQIICGQQVNFVDVLTSTIPICKLVSSIPAIAMKTLRFACW
ncbi:hypothetical protein KCP69_11610 [Salmonella enterica subsp. enterica]|nr:hypothetical protein KCP69_11610 [Salmonella enterica subsp. enterica]